jgi:hypothetical protein
MNPALLHPSAGFDYSTLDPQTRGFVRTPEVFRLAEVRVMYG